MSRNDDYSLPKFEKPIIVIVGGFGSGKTEVSVNLAKYFALAKRSQVTIADLDLVNPYFRSREVLEELEEIGITTVAPEGGQRMADLPILLPQIRGLIERAEDKLILDVGGDSQGSKALGSLSSAFKPGTYEMLMVLNSRRPQTDNVETSLTTMARIETTAQLRFTGLISNSHMIDETDLEVIMEGYALSRQISERRTLPITFVSAKRNIFEQSDLSGIDAPILPLSRSMLKPWERKETDRADSN